ncbi:MAG: trypsin-like serine protease [Planctomycetes bacterium]|nr:trypsin-like serine protease [Planctomycetota bacterium]
MNSFELPRLSPANIKLLSKIDKKLKKVDKPKRVFEKVQDGEADFLPAWFLEIGTKIARSICHLRFVDGGKHYVGTGFMLNSSLMMTNNHVFPSHKVAKTGQAIFNYQRDKNGRLEQSVNYSVNPDRFFITNEALDFTIVAIDGKPGDKYGTVQLLRDWKKVGIGDHVHIIQHPNGKPKQVVLYSNKVTDFTQATLEYKADTMGGSSGSPVFNDLWQLVALHHVGAGNHNEGIRISAILKYLGLLNSQERSLPMLSGLLDSIPDSNELGFFDMVGMTSVSGDDLEKVALNYQGTDDFVDIGYWNIEHFNNNSSHERIEAVANLIENLRLDVFGLSEISKGAMEGLINVLKGRGLNYRFDFENVRGGQDLAILYDADVVKVGALKFSTMHNRLLKEKMRGKNVFPRLPMQRKVTVKRGDVSRSFVMMVLHLKAFGDQLSKQRRRRAAEILRQIIDEQIENGITDYVVGGDMNEVLDHGAFVALTQGNGLIALTADDAASGGDAVSWIGGSNKSLIDHIFVSNDALKTTVTDSITVTRLDKSIPNFDATLSDHIPVIFRALFGNEPIITDTEGTVFEIGRYVKKIVVHE